MKYLPLLILVCIIFSCTKGEQEPWGYSEASYKMTVTMNWTSSHFTIPTGAHVTAIVGMVHSKDTFLWKESSLSTPGLEDVAEIGNTIKMHTEMDAMIAKNIAGSKFQLPAPSLTGTAETTLKVTSIFSHISFASMIAPSPDWFLGISNVNLLENNKWVKELTVNIRVYDAGTEEGNVLDLNNPPTVPQKPIMLLPSTSALSNNTATIAAIATVRFEKN